MLPDRRGILRPRMVSIQTADKFDSITSAEEMMEAMGGQATPRSSVLPVTSSLGSVASASSQHGSTASLGSTASQQSFGRSR